MRRYGEYTRPEAGFAERKREREKGGRERKKKNAPRQRSIDLSPGSTQLRGVH